MLVNVRNHNILALAELERRGYVISFTMLVRCTRLLPTRRRLKRGAYERRPYTDEEINWLEWVLVLKRLGMTVDEVRAWLAHPDTLTVTTRINATRQICTRAERLLARVLTVLPTTPNGSQGAGHGSEFVGATRTQ